MRGKSSKDAARYLPEPKEAMILILITLCIAFSAASIYLGKLEAEEFARHIEAIEPFCRGIKR